MPKLIYTTEGDPYYIPGDDEIPSTDTPALRLLLSKIKTLGTSGLEAAKPYVNEAKQQAVQSVVGAGELALSTPSEILAGLNELRALPARLATGFKGPATGTETLLGAAQKGREYASEIPSALAKVGSFSPWSLIKAAAEGKPPAEWSTGIEPVQPPATPGQENARIIGSSIYPAGAATLPIAAAMPIAKRASDWLFNDTMTGPTALAAPPTALPGPNPGLIEPGNIPLHDKPEAVSVLKDASGKYVIVPAGDAQGHYSPKAAEAAYAKTSVRLGVFADQASADAYAERLNALPQGMFQPRVTHTVENAGGRQEVDEGTWRRLGIAGAATVGFLAFPWVWKAMSSKFLRLPAPDVPVTEAPKGTLDPTRRIDLFRTQSDDLWAGVNNIMRRIGLNEADARAIYVATHAQTRHQADALASNAVLHGRFDTPSYSFKTQGESMGKMMQLDRQNPRLSPYMRLLDMERQMKAKNGPMQIRGLDLQTVRRRIAVFQASDPALAQAAAQVSHNFAETMKFLKSGQYGFGVKAPDLGTKGYATDKISEWMQEIIPVKMENEVRGMVVDALRSKNKAYAKPVSAKQLKKNPDWKKNVVEVTRKTGANKSKRVQYVTAPYISDVLHIDPYFFVSPTGQAINSAKKLYTTTLTGTLNPFFAPVPFTRNFLLARTAIPKGRKGPSVLGTLTAPFEQTGLEAAKQVSGLLDGASNGWLGKTLGPDTLSAISRRLMLAYERSDLAQMEAAGAHRGAYMQMQFDGAMKLGDRVFSKMPKVHQAAWQIYREAINSMQNAASYSFTKRNMKGLPKSKLGELLVEARDLTGDPTRSGQFTVAKVGEGRMGNLPIRGPSKMSAGEKNVWSAYGRAQDFARVTIPYYNVQLQSIRRNVLQAYWDDPLRFTARAYAWVILPETIMHFYNRSIGSDPQGVSYADYAANMRPEWATQMYSYIGIPGKPASEGIEVPRAYELAGLAQGTHVLWEHLLGSMSGQSTAKDLQDVATQWLGNITGVGVPVPGPQIMGYFGYRAPINLFGGADAAWQPRVQDPGFNKSAPFLPSNIQTLLYGFVPGLAQLYAAGDQAWSSKDGGLLEKAKAAGRATASRAVQKTPYLRDVLGIHYPMNVQGTKIAAEFRAKAGAIRQLEQFYKTLDGEVGARYGRGRSNEGGVVAKGLLYESDPGKPPPANPGLEVPLPTNPLYAQFMQELHAAFGIDQPSKGGQAFPSLLQNYHEDQKWLTKLRQVNAGNLDEWKAQIAEKPDILEYARINGTDPNDPHEMLVLYSIRVFEDIKIILHRIKQVENEFSKRLGQEVKLEALKPYLDGGP